ncbi:MAG: IS1634 family transposase [Snowella sp.]
MTQLTVKNLDHLGIIAAIVDELGIVDYLNEQLKENDRAKISAGLVVKAMILNGLGFVNSPLYLFSRFFEDKPLEHLLGKGIKASDLNDDRLGRVLDLIFIAGISRLFLGICLKAVEIFKIMMKSSHLDSSSLSVEGEYKLSVEREDKESQVIHITHGYSKDKRPDLKQFVLNLVCWGDGEIPAFLELGDGNQSDKKEFAELLKKFKEQWQFEGLHVADSALYSADNLQKLIGINWLCSVPKTIREVQDVLSKLASEQFTNTDLDGYRLSSVESKYAGIEQRWLVVESEQKKALDLKQLTKKIEKATAQTQKQLEQLHRQEFACREDALTALGRWEKSLEWHYLQDLTVVEKCYYGHRGKPRLHEQPTRRRYHAQATLSLNRSKVQASERAAGRSVLATNQLDTDSWSDEQMLVHYKQQQGVERGFRFLKDPLFFASCVFLKTPERIMALAFIMALCLLVYGLGQRQLRLALAEQGETVPNQLGKPTQRPTLRWIFQTLGGIHWVVLDNYPLILNLTLERERLLRFFGTTTCQYYLLS